MSIRTMYLRNLKTWLLSGVTNAQEWHSERIPFESPLAGFAPVGEDGDNSWFCMRLSVLKSPARSLSPSAAKLRLLKKLRCTLRFEKKAWQSGARLVAGVDEVGRGSLFGCVVAGAVILDPSYRMRGLRDSKLLFRRSGVRCWRSEFVSMPLHGPSRRWMLRASTRSTFIMRRELP